MFRDDFAEQLALLAVKLLALRGGVAASVLRVLGFDGQLDEARAQALDLFLYGGAQIVCGNYGAKTTRGGDGLQPCDSAAQNQYPRRSDGTGSGGHHRENFRQRVRGDE